MNESLDDQYLEWVYALVGPQDDNVRHTRLLMHLLSTEFVPMPEAPNDENRCMDGVDIRKEFKRTHPMIFIPDHWMSMGCSVLEMMIGVAHHLSFTAEGEDGEWFWHLIHNLGLTRYDDRRYHKGRCEEIIERLIWRKYSYDGNGGLFPLRQPQEDQRNVEIWFQMESYILELG